MLKLAALRVDSQCMAGEPRNPVPKTALVADVIAEGPTCLECIAKRCVLSPAAAETVLTVIQRSLAISRLDASRCQVCGRIAVVFSVTRPSA
jgi:hypothetical protein